MGTIHLMNTTICVMAQNNLKKLIFEGYSKLHFLPHVSCQIEFNISCGLYHLFPPPDDVLSKISDLSHNFQMSRKSINLKVSF